MSILSLEFLILMAVLLVVYYCLPVRQRWLVLLAASLVFYAGTGVHGLAYLGVVSLITWAGGLYMGHSRAREKAASGEEGKVKATRIKKRRTRLLALLVLLVIGGMAVIKYGELLYHTRYFRTGNMGYVQ